MSEFKIYDQPLGDAIKEHYASILKHSNRYHLIDIVKALKFGRPVSNQDMMDEWIAMMELSPERGEPFK